MAGPRPCDPAARAAGVGPLDPAAGVGPLDPAAGVGPLDPAAGVGSQDPAAGVGSQDPAAGVGPADEVFRKYYTDKDYSTSLEGVLKLLSAIVSVVSTVLFLGWSACPRSPGLVSAAAGAALAGGAACALMFGGVVLLLPLRAPQFYLLTDIIVSTVTGLLLLLTAVLNITVCEFYSVVSYLHGPLAVLNAGMVIASAVITYVGVMRLWDAAHPPQPPPAEHDV